MVCIYCSGKTKVNNSRSQRSGLATWRRRECKTCGAVFTTTESADLEAALRVETKKGELVPLVRDKLFYSLVLSCGHRKSPVDDSSALTDTIIHKILRQNSAIITTAEIKKTALQTLQGFDAAAATYYSAYF